MRDISKIYSLTGTKANDSAELEVSRGEIHALVGENGAGKTTLMKILYGLEKPDSGEILIDGEEVEIHGPADADRLGIGMVHQHFKLINEFTAAQNIVLGAEPLKRRFFFDNKSAEKQVSALIDSYYFNIPVDLPVSRLSAGQKQQVEIIRLLYRKSTLLILDEPTSVLTEKEVEGLFNTLRRLRDSGKTIILITHKLSEVKEISDRITVMRKGQTMHTAETNTVDEREISRMMIGRDIDLKLDKPGEGCREPVLEVSHISLGSPDHKHKLLDDISFNVSSCEILGITAAAGNGLAELEDVIAGIRPFDSGSIHLDENDVSGQGWCTLRRSGMAYVPADRLQRGSSLESSLGENLIILKRYELSGKYGRFSGSGVKKYTDRLIDEYSIEGDSSSPIGTLSGGNIQKAVLARELDNIGDLVLFSEPAWGLDVSAGAFIYRKILSMKKEGVAVILISSNLDEITALSDRIIVLYRGRIVTRMTPGEDNSDRSDLKEKIGEYLMGLNDDYAR